MEPAFFERPADGYCNLFEDLLRRGLSIRVRVTGCSMAPFLKGGEVLTIKPAHPASLRRGDLIFYKDGCGAPVLHRLVRMDRSCAETVTIQTKGDALPACDAPISHEEILGKVCRVEYGGPDSKGRCLDMETFFRRDLNYLVATKSLMQAMIHRILSAGLSRLRPSGGRP